jgi:hypothetical protein
MAYFKLNATLLNYLATYVATDLDTAVSVAYMGVYDGTIPATPATAITSQVLLGSVTMSADPSATVSGNIITFNPINQDNSADTGGTATWIRIFKGDGSTWADVDVGTLASSATAKMNSTTVVAGGPIRVNSFTISIG